MLEGFKDRKGTESQGQTKQVSTVLRASTFGGNRQSNQRLLSVRPPVWK